MVDTGSYEAGSAIGERFARGAIPASAVRVGLSTAMPVNFGRAIGLPSSVPIRVAGTAASARFAAFTVGSGVAALDGGIANAVLGALLSRFALAGQRFTRLAP